MRLETLRWIICVAGLIVGALLMAVFMAPTLKPAPAKPHLRLESARPTTVSPVARAHYEAALDALAADDWRLVVEETTAAIRLNADYPEAYFARALGRQALGLAKSAVRDFDRAIDLEPEAPDYHSAKARLHFEQEDFPACESAVAEALKYAPDNSDDWDLRGNCVFEQGRLEDALTHFERAIGIDAANVQARADRALTLIEMGRIRQGIRGARQVVATRTTDLYALTKCLDIFIRFDLKRDMSRTINLIRLGYQAQRRGVDDAS